MSCDSSSHLWLPDSSTSNHWIMALQKRHGLFPMCYLNPLCQSSLFKSSFGLIRPCTAHTPASCKTLANSFYRSDATSAVKWTMSAKAQAKARSLDLWPRSQRSSLPSALSQAVCWVTAFRNPLRKPGNLAPTFLEDRTVQIYSINIPLTPHYIFIGGTRHRHEEGRDALIMAVVLITPRSPLAIKLSGDSVWECEWLSQQKKYDLFSFQLSFLVWAEQLPQIVGTFQNASYEDD